MGERTLRGVRANLTSTGGVEINSVNNPTRTRVGTNGQRNAKCQRSLTSETT